MAKNDTTVKVKALVPVNYDDTLYGPDEPAGVDIDVRETDLAQLLAVNAVELVAPDVAQAQ